MTPFLPGNLSVAELCRDVLQSGLGLLIQSTLLLAAGLAVGRGLAARGPALQSLVYRTTLIGVLLTSLLSVLLAGSVRPFWSLSLPPAPRPDIRPAVAPTHLPLPTPAWLERPSLPSAAPSATRPGYTPTTNPARRVSEPAVGASVRFYAGAVIAWGGAAALLLGWLLLSHLWVGRLRRSCVPIQDGVAAATLGAVCQAMRIRPPLLLAGRRVPGPFLTGGWRPAILLPADYKSTFDAPALRAVMVHELTHLARRDCAWTLMARLICSVLWPQPLLWLLTGRLAQVGEEICDQAVLQEAVNPRAYAECLLRLAERLVSPWPERATWLGVVPFRSSVGRRIEQILNGSRPRTLSVTASLRASVALGAAAAVAGGLALVSAAPRPAASPKGKPAMKAADKPAGGPVSGRVVTPDGRPVAGATVSWVGHIGDEDALLASVQTDAAGQFRFADTTPLRHKDDYPRLVAEAPGWGLAFQPVPENRAAAEIRLPLPTELRVRFLAPNGQPVPDLKIKTVFFGAAMSACDLPPGLDQRYSRRTDSGGAVTIAGLPQAGRVRLDVVDDRFAHLADDGFISLQPGPITQAVPVHLVAGCTIRGRVAFGPSAEPAPGVKVSAQAMESGHGYGDGVSGTNGEYRLTQIAPGPYNVALGLNDELARSWTARAHEGVYLGAGEHLTGIDFTLNHGAVIRGRAIAEDTGAAIPGMGISIYGPAHPRSSAWVQGTSTGPDGAYQLRVPGGRQYLYYASAAPPPGFLMPNKSSYDLTVRDGETTTIDFKFPRGGRRKPVRGQVLGPDGKPVAGAQIIATSLGRFGGGSPLLLADTGGSFEVSADRLSGPAALRARSGNLATPAGVTVTGGESVTLRLRPDVLASLTGQVTDPAGHPIHGAQIWLFTRTFGGGSGTVATNTDEHGRYTIPSLWPDQGYSIYVTASGFGVANSGDLQLKPGETRTLAPMTLKVADRSVAGRVLDQNGEPIVGASVRVDGRETGFQNATTDSSGRFGFAAVVNEKLSIQANHAGYRYAHKDTAAGSSDLVLVLQSEAEKERSEAKPAVEEQFDALRGLPAPPLHAVAWVNSAPLSMAQLRGKVVLIDFWGIGCGPCVASLPGVQRAATEFSRKGVVVIGLHNAGASRSELQAFARKHGLTYPLAIDVADDKGPSFGQTFREYTVQGIPSVAVIARNGRIAYVGHLLDQAIETLGPLLAQNRVGGKGRTG